MPTTVNGIGTHYYGKRNHTKRQGTCRACGRVGELESYDTRLFFVVIFIPIIPLGRKRIIDECPACRRHFVADQDQYMMGRQLALSGALDQFHSAPSSEAAVLTHGQMLGFHGHEEAKAFREEAIKLFPDDALMHAVFALQMDEIGEYSLATPLYERALQLRPDLPEARDGVAIRRIVDGKLDEARQLVSHLEAPGAGQMYSLGRLQHLAEAYQNAGRHEETLALCNILIRELPQAAQHYDFRKFVRKSEQALRRPTSIMPQRETSWRAFFDSKSGQYPAWQRWAVYLTIVVILAGGGMALLNEYKRQHRSVQVYNEFGDKVQISIDGAPVSVAGTADVVVSEGKHRVAITGAVQDEFDLDVNTPYWQRWTYRPVWIVNVGGATSLLFETLYYAQNPRPADQQVLAGDRTFFAPHIDYRNETPPPSMKVESATAEVVKTHLGLLPEKSADLLQYLMTRGSPEPVRRFAESRVILEPNNSELLKMYLASLKSGGELDRAKTILKTQLDVRPVNVNWHRHYQEVHQSAAAKQELTKEYDKLIAAEPGNAALLYLRGRIGATTPEKNDFFQRAIQADPKIGWPWMALGYAAFTRGDWAKTVEYTKQAIQLGIPASELRGTMHAARCGLGEHAELEAEYRKEIVTGSPQDSLPALLLLCDVLLAKDQLEPARQAIANWEGAIPVDQRPTQFLDTYRGLLAFMAGDFPAVEQAVASGKGDSSLKLVWLVSTGRAAEAAADPGLAAQLANPWNALALSTSFALAGNPTEAQTWREKACVALDALDVDEVQAAKWLRSDSPPTAEQFDDIGITPTEKSLWAAALALKFPEHHAELSGHAKRLLVMRTAHYHLVRQVIDRKP